MYTGSMTICSRLVHSPVIEAMPLVMNVCSSDIVSSTMYGSRITAVSI